MNDRYNKKRGAAIGGPYNLTNKKETVLAKRYKMISEIVFVALLIHLGNNSFLIVISTRLPIQ